MQGRRTRHGHGHAGFFRLTTPQLIIIIITFGYGIVQARYGESTIVGGAYHEDQWTKVANLILGEIWAKFEMVAQILNSVHLNVEIKNLLMLDQSGQ